MTRWCGTTLTESRFAQCRFGAAAVLATVGLLFAQVRHEVGISAPANPRSVGSSGYSRSFTAHSYGIGALSGYSSTPGSNLLRSSLSRSPITVRPVGGGGGAPGPMRPLTALPGGATGFAFQPVAPRLVDPGQMLPSGAPQTPGVGLGEGPTLPGAPRQVSGMMGLGEAYLGLVAQEAGVLESQSGPVRSLAPTGEAGLYGRYLTAGEQAMQRKDYNRAAEQFELAYDLDRRSPESLLSLAHARLALAQSSYRRPAWYLQQALRYLPELPLAQLDLRGLFPAPDELHVEVLPRLTEHLSLIPEDSYAYLLLAYILWFDDNALAAQDALALARRGTQNEEMVEAIDAFWDGMKAAGKVTGELEPNQQLRRQGLVGAALAGPPDSQPAP